jgi:crotonobetainyl-CoA:carnitine CoA-transferase CaiB-like acyl-CoA transferase
VIDSESTRRTSPISQPLEGVRTVVLGGLAAGTIAGSLLSDLGAEVIHVSSPRGGDHLTRRPPVVNDESLAWQIIARSSKSATCDLDTEAGAQLMRELLQHVDVVIESFGPRGLEEYGLDPTSFPASVVTVRISAYGQDGPYSTYPGDDLTSLAFSGLAHLTGHREGAPVPLATAIADYLCAVACSQAAISSLVGRVATGHGDVIDASLYGAALRITEWAIPAADRLGTNRTREGNFPRNAAPLGVYSSKDDQYVAIVGGTDANFQRLVDAMQDPAISNPRFKTPAQRSQQADELNSMVRAWAATLTIEELETRCLTSGVPFGRVYTARDLSTDPHFVERGDLTSVESNLLGPVIQPSPYPLFMGSPTPPPVAPSALGQDNEYVWGEVAGRASEGLAANQLAGGSESSATSAESLSNARRPLDGITVLELGSRIASVFASGILAEQGATVIKIEDPSGGDVLRTVNPFDGAQSLFFAAEDRNRKGVTLNLRDPTGQELFRELASKADVLCENFRPGTMERWHMGPSDVNPDLIYARVSVFGQGGPYSERPGLDLLGVGYGGLLYMTGPSDQPPVKSSVTISDHITAMFLSQAITAALYRQRVTGEKSGVVIDASLYGSILRTLEATLAEYAATGVAPARGRSRPFDSAPSGLFATSDDSWIAVSGGSDVAFASIARLLDQTQWCDDPLFTSMQLRFENGTALNAVLADWVRQRTAEEAIAKLREFGVPVSLVNSPLDLLNDPHVTARNDLPEFNDHTIGPLRLPAPFPRFASFAAPREGAPTLGEHNREVWGELVGISVDRLETLKGEGVI